MNEDNNSNSNSNSDNNQMVQEQNHYNVGYLDGYRKAVADYRRELNKHVKPNEKSCQIDCSCHECHQDISYRCPDYEENWYKNRELWWRDRCLEAMNAMQEQTLSPPDWPFNLKEL